MNHGPMILVQPTLRIINNLGRRITCPCEEAPSIKNQVDDFNMDLSRRYHVLREAPSRNKNSMPSLIE